MLTRYIPLLFLGLCISCGSENTADDAQPVRPALKIDAVVLTAQPFDNDLTTTAQLLANEQVELKAPVSGTVLGIYFKEGERIKKGDLIIRLDDRPWRAQLSGLQAQLSSAEKDLERKKSLLEIEGSSQQQIEQVQASVDQLKSQLNQLRVNIELAHVRAPFGGRVGLRDFSPGAYLKEGETITTITDMSMLKVDFSLPEEYQQNITKGKTIDVIVEKDTLKAEVYAISPMISADSRTLHVRALLKPTGAKKITPGAFAEVVISTDFEENALLVPTQSIVPEINDQTVYVIRQGKAVRQIVGLGIRTSDKVHVKSGLHPGDTVLTTGLLQVKDGMVIQLQSVKKQTP